jgi:hypothetical protein
MVKLTIYRYIKDINDANKIIGKITARVINVDSNFIGFGRNGVINKAEFQRLADDLEPGNDHIFIA